MIGSTNSNKGSSNIFTNNCTKVGNNFQTIIISFYANSWHETLPYLLLLQRRDSITRGGAIPGSSLGVLSCGLVFFVVNGFDGMGYEHSN